MDIEQIAIMFKNCVETAVEKDDYQTFDWQEYTAFLNGVYEALLPFCDDTGRTKELLYMLKEYAINEYSDDYPEELIFLNGVSNNPYING